MKTIQFSILMSFLLLLAACGDDDTGANVQSNRCNSGQQATLTLNITGVGNFTYSESNNSISHATDVSGSLVDAFTMYMVWLDETSGDKIQYDITVENETIIEDNAYVFDDLNFNGTVNFYLYKDGEIDEHYTFVSWETTINEMEEYETSSSGGFTTTRYAFVDATTSGVLRKSGVNYDFTSSYTICPKY